MLEAAASRGAVAERSTPARHMAATAYYAGFAGPEEGYGTRLAPLEAWGAGREIASMTIHKITRRSVDAAMTSAFRVGRVFLLGDAAHRHPPTGGLGLTSAIHDAQNPCWKLAAVLAGAASPDLLDTYEPERCSADERNASPAAATGRRHPRSSVAAGGLLTIVR